MAAEVITWTWSDDFDTDRQSGEHAASGTCRACCETHGYPRPCECGGTEHAESADLSNDPESSSLVHVVYCDRERGYQFM